MEEYVVKKYRNDELIEKEIKKLTINVMVEENGFGIFKDDYLNRDYKDEKLHIWYIEDNNSIISVVMLKEIGNNIGKVENVCCSKDYRGKKITQKVFDEMIEFANQINLEKLVLGTYECLGRAIGFYLKNGFTEIVEKYEPNTTARYYEKTLN